MYAIETDLGRFQADSEKEAKRLLRKAQTAQAKIDAEANRKYKQARLLACAQAYAIYDRLHSDKDMPRGWRLLPVTATSTSAREIYDSERHERGYTIETGEGMATAFPYSRISSFLENGSGYCMAIYIENEPDLYAVGTFEDTIAWVPVHGVDSSKFNQGRE